MAELKDIIGQEIIDEYNRVSKLDDKDLSELDRNTIRFYEVAKRRLDEINDLTMKMGDYILANQNVIPVKNITSFKTLYNSLIQLIKDDELKINDDNKFEIVSDEEESNDDNDVEINNNETDNNWNQNSGHNQEHNPYGI